MATFKVAPGQLGVVIKRDGQKVPERVAKAMFNAAQRARSFLVPQSPVDRGILRNAWKVVKFSKGVELLNDAPYAGIVERGIAPGAKFGRAAHDAIMGWVKRKLMGGLTSMRKVAASKVPAWAKSRSTVAAAKQKAMGEMDEEASRIAWLIIWKMQARGREGTWFVKKNMPYLTSTCAAMINKEVSAYFNRGGGTKGP